MNWATHVPWHCRRTKFVVEKRVASIPLLVRLPIASRRGKVNGLSVLECTGGCFGNKKMAAVKLVGPSGNHCFMLCCFFVDAKAARVCHAKVTTKFTRMGFLLTTGLVGSSVESGFLGVFFCVRLFLWFQPMGGQAAA